ncbi:MAG: T9SS type A sorting domain-containing protein [Chitinophagaceae bacterium]|nr:T9SS type A sorting domain-containing protein [Chitinophagaceae bacterium]
MLRIYVMDILSRGLKRKILFLSIIFLSYYSANAAITAASKPHFLENEMKLDTGGTTLPLHNFSLTVSLKENSVYLKWLAENEMNTQRFVIQRSSDGANYQDIGYKNPAGPLNILTEYLATDDVLNFPYSIAYYRIKAEDNTNKFAYSNIVPVRLSKISGIRLWPVPITSDLKISYNASGNSILDINIADNFGKTHIQTIFNVNKGMNQVSLSGVTGLPSGFYIVRISDRNTNEIFVQKVLK